MEEKKKATDAHMKATAKYEKKNYFKTLVRFNKSDEGRIRAAAGKSLNGFIVKCVLDALEQGPRDRAAQTEPQPQRAEQPNKQDKTDSNVLLPIEDNVDEYERICAEYGGYEIVLHYSTQMELMEKYDFDGIKRLCNYAQSKTTK